MFINLFKFRLLFLLCSTFLLCQCAKVVNSTEPVMIRKKVESPYKMPVAAYLAMAKTQDHTDQQNSLLLAAGQMINNGQWRQGAAILAQTNDLTAQQLNEKNLLLAQIDLIKDRPRDALAQLANINQSNSLPTYYQIQFHELLAQTYRSLRNYQESIAERIKLESLLTDEASQKTNRRNLWLTLINLPPEELNTLALESKNQEQKGWLQLALISKTYRSNAKSLLAALDQWQTQFSNHPANQLLPNPLDSIANKMISSPKKVALLLPLSGALSGPGNAVKDGFMAAYKEQDAEHPQIKTYDTSKQDVATLYEQALNDGAEYIVGPLTKTQVAAVASLNHPVPTLLLNDASVDLQDNSYLFGLSPVNEAVQVAIKAKSQGYRRALIITPQNEWGNEVAKAFDTEWQKKGGLVVDTLSYGPTDDLNKKIRNFLRITDSQTREKRLKELLGQKLQSSTSRRQDFDMIFLLAYPSKARQIMPLLKYYYAGDVPVFATSSVYGGSANALKDKDLDGIMFCDIPWVFSHQMGTRNWPEQFNSYNRLYALGKDSYALATQLNQLILFPADGAMETNGTLYLKPSQQVARVLEWGQFRQGLVHSLESKVLS